MAREIITLHIRKLADGRTAAEVAFLYPVDPVIQDFTQEPIIPTDVAGMHPDHRRLLSAGEDAALRAGQAMTHGPLGFTQGAEESLGAMLTRIRGVYEQFGPGGARDVVDLERVKWSLYGARFDKE